METRDHRDELQTKPGTEAREPEKPRRFSPVRPGGPVTPRAAAALAPLFLAAAVLFLLPTPPDAVSAGEGGNEDVVWSYRGGAQEWDLFVPVPFDNVKDSIPPEHWDHVLTTRSGGEKMAVLFLDLKWAPRAILTHGNRGFEQDHVSELLIGVLYSRTGYDDAFQFYTLVRLTDFDRLAAAHEGIGLPSVLVKDIRFDVAFDPLTGLGRVRLDVPWQASPFRVVQDFAVVNPAETSGQAGEFHHGRHGLVRVTHVGTPAVQPAAGTVYAAPGTVLAHWLGGTTAEGSGLYLDFNPEGHALTAEIVEP